MAQLIVRNLDDDVRDRLKVLAAAHGWSMEEEVRAILRSFVLRSHLQPEEGLGSRIARRFRTSPFEGDIEEIRGEPPRPADFGS